MAIIDLQNLKFAYSAAHPKALTIDIAEFSVEAGECVFLFGPSGSGKTTFLELLAGVLAPQSGSLKICGQDLSQMSLSQRDQFRSQHIGYIFQSFNLIPYLNARENIELVYHLSEARRKRVENLNQEISHLAEKLAIGHLLNQPVSQLSVGQQQRVAVARALLGSPEVILADEPTSALDTDHREKFLNLLFDVCREHNSTLVFVSHDRSIQHLFSRHVGLAQINGELK